KNQADILYCSGHGSRATGSLQSLDNGGRFKVNDVNPAANWREDLEYFVIAACGVLRPDNINGFAWGNATLKKNILKGLCGYYGRAPSDAGGKSVEVAKAFATFLTTQQPPTYSGNRVLDAWLKANRDKDAEAIAYNSSNYWKVRVLPGPFDYIEGPSPW
ncbi:MAG: DUF6345 domain-containing protein, partial [Armatimonadetes bacterium]|nr:DUF6345 domain-containing protein [Armatimonadota bacterium]